MTYNNAEVAEQTATIFRLRLAGQTYRQIAAAVGCSLSTVHKRLETAMRELVEPDAQELRKLTGARLDDLRVKASAMWVKAGGDTELRLKAWDRLMKAEERAAKLYGLDAPEQLAVTLDARLEVEAANTVEAIMSSVDAVLVALPGLDGAFQAKLRMYALEHAKRKLHELGGGEVGPAPEVPAPQLALPPGSPEPPSPAPEHSFGPVAPAAGPEDGADAVLALLADFQDEYPDAFEESA